MKSLVTLVLIAMLAFSGQSLANDNKLPKTVIHPSGLTFQLCSQQTITKAFFFDVVHVGLYYPSCPEKMTVFNDDSKLLRFHYLRKVTGKQFKKGAEEYLTYNLNKHQHDKCFSRYKDINDSYLDVDDGDYYDLFQIENKGLDLFLNEKSISVFKNKECESLYFNIWFGKKSMSTGFKKLLSQ
ncbi:MAG: chalcone isomerase family protein [Gammaproteobacteria bacterium]|nr:chalcone isomerase family protein [Gammaproteobacteria bacterium]